MSEARDAGPESLLNAARAGDVSALGRLLELYRDYLSLLARVQIGRRLQRKVDSADLIQDTFLEACRHFRRFRGATEGEFVSWLRQIFAANLANLIRRYYGVQRRDVRLERELADDLDKSSQMFVRAFVSPDSSPSQRASRREEAVRVANALERLPADYRQIILLCHFDGLGFPEAAQHMGRSLHSVKHLWTRALGRLRREVENAS